MAFHGRAGYDHFPFGVDRRYNSRPGEARSPPRRRTGFRQEGGSMTVAANLGFPRIGANRELKRALEDHWAGRASESDLLAAARSLRRDHWLLQKRLGLGAIPCNDFSFYDQVLDAAVLVGAIPSRYGGTNDTTG